jgi:hypothetical protein
MSQVEATILDLPSRYAFYDFKDLYVTPFKGKHLAKLSRAREEGSIMQVVESVNTVLSNTNGDQHLAYKLTLADFYFVLYWLRLNSFTKSVFIHTTTCPNEDHIQQVTEGKLLPDTLKMSEIIHKSTLKTNMLDTIPDPAAFPLEYPGVYLTSVTMLDVVTMTEDPRMANDPEFRYASQIAVYLRLVDNPNADLDTRLAIVDDMSPDDIDTVKAYEKAINAYGIEESIQVTCKACGHSHRSTINIDAHSFFPSAA